MIDQPEQDEWEGRKAREADEKKLFALHSENKRLQAQQEEFQLIIQDYIIKMNLFSQKSLILEEENSKLRSEVGGWEEKSKRLQDLLNKRNEEYCSMYSYLFTERRTSIQDIFAKEIDINNKLNQIQHQSDSEIIDKLKATVKAKNQDLMKQSKRISELEDSLISSTLDYQQQIASLKYENKHKISSFSLQQQEQIHKVDITSYCADKKIEGLKNQIALYRAQLSSRKKQVNQLRIKLFQLSKQNHSIQNELKQLKENHQSFDGNVFSIMSQNAKLRIEIEREKAKQHFQFTEERQIEFNKFIDNKLQISNYIKQSDKLNDQIHILKTELDLKTKQNCQLRAKNKQFQQNYASLKLIAASSFNKLKKVIQFYSPFYFKREKLELYTLEQQQKEFFLQHTVDKALTNTRREICLKINQNAALKQKESQYQRTRTIQAQTIKILQKSIGKKDEQIRLLSETSKALIARSKQQERVYINVDNEYQNQYYQQDMSQQQNDVQIIEKSHSLPTEINLNFKVQTLERALEQMQSDRTELLQIIKGRDKIITQLSAEINALKNISNVITLNFQSFVPQSKSLTNSVCKPLSQQQLQAKDSQLLQLREQLSQLSNLYKQQKGLIMTEYEKREVELLNKNMYLLKNYEQLLTKYNTLQSSLTNRKQLSANNQVSNQEIINQVQSQFHHLHHEVIHPQNDQNAISESAIQNFTDILKKYEKQFSKYVSIYQNQIKKSLEGNMINQDIEGQENLQLLQEAQNIQRLQQVLSQQIETIKHLENTLIEKDKQAQIQAHEVSNQLKTAKQTVIELSKRVVEAEKAISQLRGQVLQQGTKLDFGSQESANSTFLILNQKNQQINSLKHSNESLKQSCDGKCKQILKLKDQSNNRSDFEVEEYKLFKEIIQEDLLGVLEGVIKHLQ